MSGKSRFECVHRFVRCRRISHIEDVGVFERQGCFQLHAGISEGVNPQISEVVAQIWRLPGERECRSNEKDEKKKKFHFRLSCRAPMSRRKYLDAHWIFS